MCQFIPKPNKKHTQSSTNPGFQILHKPLISKLYVILITIDYSKGRTHNT